MNEKSWSEGKHIHVTNPKVQYESYSTVSGRNGKIVTGYHPRNGIHKWRNGQVCLRLVLVQKRTRLEFYCASQGAYIQEGCQTLVHKKHVIAESVE